MTFPFFVRSGYILREAHVSIAYSCPHFESEDVLQWRGISYLKPSLTGRD